MTFSNECLVDFGVCSFYSVWYDNKRSAERSLKNQSINSIRIFLNKFNVVCSIQESDDGCFRWRVY